MHLTKSQKGTSLVVQWLRVCLAVQGTPVQPMVQEDPHAVWQPCSGHSCLEPVVSKVRSHHNEKPEHRNWRKPARVNEDPVQPKIPNYMKLFLKKPEGLTQIYPKMVITCSSFLWCFSYFLSFKHQSYIAFVLGENSFNKCWWFPH